MDEVTRRGLLRSGTQGAVAAAVLAGLPPEAVQSARAEERSGVVPLWPGYPRQDQKLVAELVGVSHFNAQRVKELLKAYPELVNASWDWGFGDWETPLGAASHTGQREIAEFLLGHGARMDIFAAAMLGLTDVVRGFVSAQPGIQRTLGPHGITLMAHARAGGGHAADTVKYLDSLQDADLSLNHVPLTADRRKRYLGQFKSEGDRVTLTCRLNSAGLLVVDVEYGEFQSRNRIIHCRRADEFYPSGVPSVRIHFTLDGETPMSVTLSGSVPEMTLKRSEG